MAWKGMGRSALLALVLGLLAATAALAEPRFVTPPPGGALPLSREVLSDDERRFLAGLPEIRVALQRVGAPPFEVVGPDGEVSGFQAEMLVYLARIFGLRVRPVIYDDWPGVLRAIERRDVDMVLTLAISNERLKTMAFTLGTVPVPVGLFARPGTLTPPAQALFAMEAGYASIDRVRRQYPDARIETHPGTLDALRAVAAGRADYYSGSLLEALALLAREPVAGLEVRSLQQNESRFYHFGIRKDWAALAPILNRGISSLRVSSQRVLAAAAASLPAGTLPTETLVLDPAAAAALEQHPVWRVGAVRGLPMLNDFDARSQHSGIAAEYTEQVARRLGVGTELIAFDDVAQMLDALRDNRIDVVPFLSRTEERARRFSFSKPYVEIPYVLVGRSDGPIWWDLGSLRGRSLALEQQHPLRDLLAQRHPDIRIVDAASGSAALDMVAEGAADAAVEVKLFANLRINGDDGQSLRVLGTLAELPARFHFATAPQAAALLPLIDLALDDIPAAERERMLRRWVAMDLQPPFPWRRWLPLLGVAAAALLAVVAVTALWTRRLAREVQRRRRADEQLDDIGRTMPGLAFRYVLDAQGRLRRTFYSSGAGAFLGVEPQRGQTLLDVLGPRLEPEALRAAESAQRDSLASGEPFRFKGGFRHPDGHTMWLRCEAVRSLTDDGLTAWTGYVIDASREQALQQRLARDADERYVLLASASHELRAPTHTLALALQSLPESAVQPGHRRALRIAREASRTLAQLLDDVLDAARASVGRIELRPQAFDLHALLEQALEAQAAALQAKGLAATLDLAPDLPRTVCADPLRLKQVLTNLLSNAAKYTEQGGVTLRAARREGAAPTLAITVEDTGIGLSPSLQQRLFEPFAAGEHDGTRSTGLGLSVCRRLMGLMGGSIELRSTPGQGTTVTVQLPLVLPGDAPAAAPPAPPEGLLMVCDDDPVSRMLLAHGLAGRGFAVVEAGSADAALARWREGGVSAIITDMNMPGRSGAELIAALRAEEAGRGVHTVVVVCSGDPAPAQQSQAPAYDAFISKPVDMHTLFDTLAGLKLTGRAA